MSIHDHYTVKIAWRRFVGEEFKQRTLKCVDAVGAVVQQFSSGSVMHKAPLALHPLAPKSDMH